MARMYEGKNLSDKETDRCYREGQAAYAAGFSLDHNPYSAGDPTRKPNAESMRYYNWRGGWHYAAEQQRVKDLRGRARGRPKTRYMTISTKPRKPRLTR